MTYLKQIKYKHKKIESVVTTFFTQMKKRGYKVKKLKGKRRKTSTQGKILKCVIKCVCCVNKYKI